MATEHRTHAVDTTAQTPHCCTQEALKAGIWLEESPEPETEESRQKQFVGEYLAGSGRAEDLFSLKLCVRREAQYIKTTYTSAYAHQRMSVGVFNLLTISY